jgi:predicted enzyme related to lactoylglutathione lyase
MLHGSRCGYDHSIERVSQRGQEDELASLPGMGAYARVTDTEGNVIELFESA